MAVVSVPATPAAAFADPTAKCWAIAGIVMDPYGRPASGALITTNGGCEGPVGTATTSDGYYNLLVKGNLLGASTTVRITKVGYTTQDKTVSSSVMGMQSNSGASPESQNSSASNAGRVLDPADVIGTNDVVLQYGTGAVLTPALRSGETLTLSARSPAPPASDPSSPGAHVLVDLPSGITQQLVVVATDADGLTRWTGSFAVPATTAEGSYSTVFCVVDQSFSGSCAQARQLHESGTRVLVSPLELKTYVVDNTPPELTQTSPDRFADVDTLGSISASWADPRSGVDSSSLVMWVDGSPTAVTASASTVTAHEVVLPPGIHHVGVLARDLAGNTATESFLFTLVSITGSAGTATLLEKIVEVNPSGSLVPPSTVRFVAPPVDVSATTESLNATTRVGSGFSARSFDLGTVDVTFRNGPLTQTVSVAVPPATESHPVAVLAPSAASLEAVIPVHQTSISDLEVAVPVGFGTQGSTAVLAPRTVPLGPHVSNPAGFLADELLDNVAVLGTVGVCLAGDGTGTQTGCELDAQGGVTIGTGAATQSVYVPTDQVEDPSTIDETTQTCDGCTPVDPIRPASYASFALQCPSVFIAIDSYNLCTGVAGGLATPGPWAAYLNAWLYQDPNGASFPVWRQDHAEATTSSCPNGLTGEASARTYRFVANTLSNDGSTGAIVGGTWDDPNNRRAADETVYLGHWSGNDRDGQRKQDSTVGFQLSNVTGPQLQILQTGSYLPVRVGTSVAATGTELQSASAASSGWHFGAAPVSSGAGVSGRIHLISGTEFRSPTTRGLYDLTASLAFQFVLDMSGCQR